MARVSLCCVQLSTASRPRRCCVSVGAIKGATATPSAQALGAWQEGRRCAVEGRAPGAGLRRCLGDIGDMAVMLLQFHTLVRHRFVQLGHGPWAGRFVGTGARSCSEQLAPMRLWGCSLSQEIKRPGHGQKWGRPRHSAGHRWGCGWRVATALGGEGTQRGRTSPD